MSSGSIGPASFARIWGRALFVRCSITTVERARLAALPNLARRGGVSAPQICSREEAERELEASAKFGVALVALGEAHYPRRLQMIDDAPPPLLAIRGNAGVLAMLRFRSSVRAMLRPPA